MKLRSPLSIAAPPMTAAGTVPRNVPQQHAHAYEGVRAGAASTGAR
jgi:hypothetical protein